jgi:hypothetical protein
MLDCTIMYILLIIEHNGVSHLKIIFLYFYNFMSLLILLHLHFSDINTLLSSISVLYPFLPI